MDPDASHRRALAGLWHRFADDEAATYSPLYARIAHAVGEDDELLDLVRAAPPQGHMPIHLLAAAHDLVLRGIDHPLADVYAGRSTDDPVPLFRDLCLAHRTEVVELLATRHIQTNECGRSAPIALGLAAVTDAVGVPDALVDAGASAGLNLLYDRYDLDYGPFGHLGDPASAVRVECRVIANGFRLPASTPDISCRIGLDRSPVDLSDPDARRWQLACVWPDTGRLERTRAALDLAAAERPDVRRGDMVDDLPAVLASIPGDGPVCVMTWAALAYLDRDGRTRFVTALEEAARARPIVLLSSEGRGVVELFDPPDLDAAFDSVPGVMGLARFGRAGTGAEVLGVGHGHGSWIRWLAS